LRQALRRVKAGQLHRTIRRDVGSAMAACASAHERNQPLAAITNYLQGSRRLLDQNTDERLVQLRDALEKPAIRRSAPGGSFAACATSWRAEKPNGASKASSG
jgi:hypothetical protein